MKFGINTRRSDLRHALLLSVSLIASSVTIAEVDATTITGAEVYTTSQTLPDALTITSGGSLTLGSGTIGDSVTVYTSAITNDGTINIADYNTATLSAPITGSGSLELVGHSALTLMGNNTYTGGTIIYSGTLRAGSTTALSAQSLVAVKSGATLDLDGYDSTIAGLTYFSAGGTVTLGSATLTIANNTTTGQVYNGIISGTGGVTLSAGTQYLLGENTYTGTTTIASGATLQIGGGYTSGSVAGNIVDNGTLIFYRSDDTTYTGNISGTGTLAKWGDSVLTLTGSNSYTGGTTIASGATLQIGNGGTTGSITGNIIDNGTLIFNRSDNVTYSGAISGTGGLTVNGGRLILSGANTYTGGTTIASGAQLQIGNGGTTGSIAGNIVDNGTLTFKRTDNPFYSGVISGSGGITIESGGVILTGTNTYTGTTTIASGAQLLIGNGGTTGSITGNIVNNGTLYFNRSDDLTYAGNISGTGSVTQEGSGILTLSGSNSYSDYTIISSGTLRAGSTAALSAHSAVNIASGATLNLAGYNSTIAGLSNNGAVTLGSATLTITNTTNSAYIYDGVISGTGGVTLSAGTQYLLGENTYTGGTTIDSRATLIVGAIGTTGSITGNVVDNGVLGFNRSNNISYAGNISGTGALLKIGGGVLTLHGSNSYSGTTYIYSGTLRAGSTTALSAQSTVYISSGATLDLAGYDSTVPALTGDGAVTLGSGTLTIASGSTNITYFYYGVISGTGGVTLSAGTQYLTGANTYTGGTTIARGAQLWIGNGGTSGSVVGNIVDNGTLYFDRSNSISYDGNISGTGTVEQRGGGVLTLSGSNSYSGNTIISSGTLRVGSTTALSAQSVVAVISGAKLDLAGYDSTINGLLGNGTVTLGSGTLTITPNIPSALSQYSGVISGTGGVTLSAGAQYLTGNNIYTGGTTIASGAWLQIGNDGTTGSIIGNVVDNGRLAFNRSDSTTYTGNISGTGYIAQVGSGVLTLSGSNSYSGYTTISSGTLRAGSTTALSAQSAVDVQSGATLDLAGYDSTIAGLEGNGTVTLGSGTLSISNGPGYEYSGAITGTGGLTVNGGILTLSGANTYTGGTNIANGAQLRIGSGGTTGSITGNVVNNGYLQFSWSNTHSYDGVISGTGDVTVYRGALTLTGNNSYTGTTTIASAATLTIGNGGTSGSITGDVVDDGVLAFNRSDNISYAGNISGAGTVLKTGNGDLTLSGNSSYFGSTYIYSGTLRAGSTTALSKYSDVNVMAGATLDLAGYDSTIPGLQGDGAVTLGGGTLTIAKYSGYEYSYAYGGVISGTGGVTIDIITLTLTGNNTYTGTTSIGSAATLQIGNGGTSGSVAGNIVDNGALVFNRSDTLSYAGVISGTGRLTVKGGMLILNGVNTYTGATTVSAGTLQVGDENHSTASIASSVTVEDGATLSGHGTIYGSVTADDGATVKPGGSIGTLSVTGNFTMATGSTLEVELSGDQYSTVSVTGAATVRGTLHIDANTQLASGTSYTLVSASSLSGTFSSVEVSGLSSDTAYSLIGTQTALSLTVGTTQTAISGLYSDIVTSSFVTIHNLNATLLEHPQQAEIGITVWATSFGHAATQQRTGASQNFSSRGASIIGGVDVRQESGFHYGLAVAYDQSALSVQNHGGTGLTNTAYFAANAGMPLVYGQVDGGVFYFLNTTAVRRDAMASHPDSHGFGITAQYSTHLDDIIPYARISYVRQYRDATTETGGTRNLAVAERDYNSLRGDIGARYSHDFDLGDAMKLTPEAGFGLSTELASSSRKSVVQLSSDTSSWITPDYAKPDKFSYTARAGLSLKIDQNLAFSVYASGRKGTNGKEGMLGLNGSFHF